MGPIGVALLLALDNVLPVVPSEVVLPFAGYLTADGRMSFLVVALAATAASTASAYVYYELGRRLGPDRARAAMLRIPLTDERDIDRSRQWFARHGNTAVLTGRFVPLVRSLVSLPAGTEGMGRIRFGLLTTVGSGVWNVLWLGVGRIVGQRWRDVGRYSDWMNWALVAVLVVGIVHYVWTRRHRITALSRDEA